MNVTQPPSTLTGPLANYLTQLASAFNAMPQFSYFTQTSPEGVLLGTRGDLALYNGTSSVSFVWVKASSVGVTSTSSWTAIW